MFISSLVKTYFAEIARTFVVCIMNRTIDVDGVTRYIEHLRDALQSDNAQVIAHHEKLQPYITIIFLYDQKPTALPYQLIQPETQRVGLFVGDKVKSDVDHVKGRVTITWLDIPFNTTLLEPLTTALNEHFGAKATWLPDMTKRKGQAYFETKGR